MINYLLKEISGNEEVANLMKNSQEDLKEYLRISNHRIHESLKKENGLKKLSFLSNDPDFWYNEFLFDNKRSGLDSFLRYRSAGAFGLYEVGYDDGDIAQPALEFLKQRLTDINEVKSVTIGKNIDSKEKERTFRVELLDGSILYLESDTAMSLMTDLNVYMNKIIPGLEHVPRGISWPDATYIKMYDLDASRKDGQYFKPFKYYYYHTLLSKLPDQLTLEMDKKCFEKLERRAQYIHTNANMMLVPYGYNSQRGFTLTTYSSHQKINDRLDLTMVDYEEMLADPKLSTELFQKRLKNNKCTKESIEFIVKNKNVVMPPIPHYLEGSEKNTVEGVLKRSEAVLAAYKEREN